MVKRVDKPIRLYVITLFVVLAYGIWPLVSAFPAGRGFLLIGPVFLPFNGSVSVLFSDNGEISSIILVVTIALAMLTVMSAAVTFLGVREARAATLIFLSLNLLWWYLLVIDTIINSDSSSRAFQLILELIIPPFWAGFVWWNMTRPDIAEWLAYQDSLEA